MTTTATARIADTILTQVIPALRDTYRELLYLREEWDVNQVTAQIQQAAAANQTLDGYTAAQWAAWGAVVPAILTFLNTPLSQGGPTARQILLQAYQQEAPASPVAAPVFQLRETDNP